MQTKNPRALMISELSQHDFASEGSFGLGTIEVEKTEEGYTLREHMIGTCLTSVHKSFSEIAIALFPNA